MSHPEGMVPQHPGIWKNTSSSLKISKITTIKSSNHGIDTILHHAQTLAQLSIQPRWIVLINAPNKINIKNILANAGVKMERVLLVKTKDEVETLWAMEKTLLNGNSSAVITWSEPLDLKDNRRLQIVAKSARAQAWLIENVKYDLQSDLSYQTEITTNFKKNAHSYH